MNFNLWGGANYQTANAGNHRGGRKSRKVQSQHQIEATTQTQQQAVFMTQTSTCLETLGSYLDCIVKESDPSILAAANGTVNSLISLMEMSGRDMRNKGMTEGLAAAEGMIREFEQVATTKYDGHERAMTVLQNATELLMRTLHGGQLPSLPVMESGATTSVGAGAAVNNFIMGSHQVEDVHDDAGKNEAKYRAMQRNAAAKASRMDEYEHRQVKIEAMTQDLQGKLAYAVDKEDAMRMSQEELRRMKSEQKRIEASLNTVHIDEDGPDLCGCDDGGEVDAVIEFDREETIAYVKALEKIHPGDNVDAYCELFGGLWARARVMSCEVLESGAKVFRVQFYGCGKATVRDVSYGTVHEDGGILQGYNVVGGGHMIVDDGVVGRYCSRRASKVVRQNRQSRNGGHGGGRPVESSAMDVDV